MSDPNRADDAAAETPTLKALLDKYAATCDLHGAYPVRGHSENRALARERCLALRTEIDGHIERLTAENARLRAALEACHRTLVAHGLHLPECESNVLDWDDVIGATTTSQPCDCGYDAALSAATDALKAAP
jgi:hypothetical protein